MAAPQEGGAEAVSCIDRDFPGRGPALPGPGILTARIPFLKFVSTGKAYHRAAGGPCRL